LETAFPGDGWDGDAAAAYTERNREQLDRTGAIIAVDRLVASVLARESSQISTTRGVLDNQAGWLADISLAAGTPHLGTAAQTATEIAMVTKALASSTDRLLTMRDNSTANAAELQTALHHYLTAGHESTDTPDENSRAENRDEGRGLDEGPDDNLADPARRADAGFEPPLKPAASARPAPPAQSVSAVPAASGTSAPMPASPGGGGAEMAGMVGGLVGSILAPMSGLGPRTQAAVTLVAKEHPDADADQIAAAYDAFAQEHG
jgi:hypothetical protein